MSRQITIEQAAERLGVSKQTVYRMLKAQEYEDAIRAGRKTRRDVPKDIEPYLGIGFPRCLRIGPKTTRLDESRVLAWMEERRESVA